MSGNDFENKVQQEMDGLRLRPSDTVWEKVEARIRRDKKRRRMLILWPMLLVGLSLFGYIGYRLMPGKGQPAATGQLPAERKTAQPVTHSPVVESPAVNNDAQAAPPVSTTIPDKAVADHTPATSVPARAANRAPDAKGINKGGMPVVTDRDNDDPTWSKNPRRRSAKYRSAFRRKGKDADQHVAVVVLPVPATVINPPADDPPPPVPPPVAGDKVVVNEKVKVADNPTPLPAEKTETDVKPADSNKEPTPAVTKKADRVTMQPAWEWGITASLGRADVSKNLLDLGINSYNRDNLNPSAAPLPPNYSPSEPYARAGFSLGLFARRHITERRAFRFGLQYARYNAALNVGSLVEMPTTLFVPGVGSKFLERYYKEGVQQFYTNRYHYLEIPVAVEFRLNKNPRKLPITWSLGASFTRLLGADKLLHYDEENGVYFTDASLIRKTQVQLNTGFGLPLFRHTRNPLFLHTDFRYGMTNMVNKKAFQIQHVIYGGLRLDWTLGSKKKR
jgi:Outer membrane protein beta-barrel domain